MVRSVAPTSPTPANISAQAAGSGTADGTSETLRVKLSMVTDPPATLDPANVNGTTSLGVAAKVASFESVLVAPTVASVGQVRVNSEPTVTEPVSPPVLPQISVALMSSIWKPLSAVKV